MFLKRFLMKIKIGNQTAFSAATTEEPFHYAVENRFDAFEWFPDKNRSGQGWAVEDIKPDIRSYIKETALKHNITLSVHASLSANPLDIETHGIIMKEIKFAKEIGAELINIHLYVNCEIELYVKAVMPILQQIEKTGIKITFENTPITSPEDFNRLFNLLQKMNIVEKEYIGMCFDVGHANLCSATHNDYLGFIDRLDTSVPISHMHMHENYGDYDSHLPVFTGPSGSDSCGIRGLMERLKRSRFSGSIILEQWPEPRSLLNDSRNKLLDLWNDECNKERVKKEVFIT